MRIWFDTGLAVDAQDLARPNDSVGYADALRLSFDPKLKVLGSIVELAPVDMVDILAGQKLAAQRSLHDIAMLVDPVAIGIPDPSIPVCGDVLSPHAADAAPLSWGAPPRCGCRISPTPACALVVDEAVALNPRDGFASFRAAFGRVSGRISLN